ncbi:Beta-xylosidase [Fibrobacter intestinalis]|uniref:Beta-xylosidase n=2 Tax=Fibrobacteraceae TaxID=204431 RepID=A0A1T4Q9V4_9BACT|nr:beta-xylosidase [Fibrobacter sp. NR9]SKA00543.1 Beta-xylosidase [Fibrobacter intestinalis]
MGMWLSIKSAMMKSVLFLGLALATNSMAQTIQNDEFWKDTDGNFIYSQGGGVLQVGDTYYWYGVKYNGAVTYAANPTSKNSDIGFAGVTCYSSKDLVNWKFEGIVLKPDQAAAGWFGRIGVAYNKNSKKYVLAGQGGSPSWEFGEYFATSDSPTGPFKFARVQTDLSFLVNGGTGDQTVFQDDDGKAYIICSNVKGRTNLYVSQLRDSDFLEMEASKTVNIHKSRVGGREGNAMFKHDGVYYFCSSDLHGWNTSQTYCMSATNIFGPYSEEFVLEGTQHDFSHVTQTGFFIMVNGTKGSFVVNAGDRWSDFAGNGLGFNQWLPISFESGKPVFHSLSQWNINVKEGTWSVGQGNNYCLNPSFEADRVNQTWLTGWKLASTSSENINNSKKKRTGRWSLYLTGKQTAYQTVNVPNGTYKLSGYVQSSGGQNSVKLFAKDIGSGEIAANITANSSWTKVQTATFEVTSGKVTLGLDVNGSSDQWVAIDDIELIQEKSTEITLPEIKDLDVVSKDSVIYEAEEGYIGKGVVESLHEGFSGESYVNLDNEVGSFLQIAVWNSTSGKRDFKIVYANGGKTSRPVQILVNDSIQIDSLDLSVTSDWTDWTEKTFSLGLPEGKSILTFKSLTADGAPNLDRIEYVIEDVTAIRKRNISAGLKMRKNARAFYINGRAVNENRPLPSKMKVYLK